MVERLVAGLLSAVLWLGLWLSAILKAQHIEKVGFFILVIFSVCQ